MDDETKFVGLNVDVVEVERLDVGQYRVTWKLPDSIKYGKPERGKADG